MMARTIRSLCLLGALAVAVPAAAVPRTPVTTTRRAAPARPTRRPVTPAAPVVAPEPELVPVSAADLQNTLRRLRIYAMSAPDGARAFGQLGAGTQLWILLPSCRAPDPDDPRDACPIDRLEVTALRGGGVRAGALTTVMAGEVPRRVQAFVLEESTALIRIRLVTPQGAVHYEGVIEAGQLRYLPPPIGVERDSRFTFDFTTYPAR
jgi:hypothetical protein